MSSTLGAVSPILALSLLLAVGFAAATLAKRLRFPSVTGYILAGLILGPVGLNVLPADLMEDRLRTFTDIALMLVAFGIGESLDLAQRRRGARLLVRVGLAESIGSFLLAGAGTGLAAWATGAFDVLTTAATCVAAGLIAGAIAVATAPASTIAVIRETGATGPVSRLVLSSVAINNAASITLFGLAVVASRLLLGTAPSSLWLQVTMPFAVTLGSLALGLLVGLMIDLVVHRLSRRSDVLIFALSAVFFCGGAAEYFGFSAMLAGLAAGFAVVNRDRRDVRAFRAINDFEPPIYGVFFALAGAQLHIKELIAGGVVGVVFVLLRAGGKLLGAWLGSRGSQLPPRVRRFFGLGLLSQAGLAIGLAYLVQQDASLSLVRSVLINVVVASVVVNELVGPPLLRLLLVRAGETGAEAPAELPRAPRIAALTDISIVPWTWPKLTPPERPDGTVVFGVGHPRTVRGLARMATLMAHYYGAMPLAVRVTVGEEPEDFWGSELDSQTRALFAEARDEARSMGYLLATSVEFAPTPAIGIVSMAEAERAQAIVLGHPLRGTATEFRRVVDEVAREALCPVVMVKFAGPLHTERILVPITSIDDLEPIRPIVAALASVEYHEITLMCLLPPEAPAAEEAQRQETMKTWMERLQVSAQIVCSVERTEARLPAVLEAAEHHDIVVMAAGTTRGLRRLFFGSLAEDVAARCPRTLLTVRGGLEAATFTERHARRL
ncbi:MAG: cation:proton antiporter [Armatimonadetes bacterium]|nr:cation:proton antiporter [Armatimonadota bacterium]